MYITGIVLSLSAVRPEILVGCDLTLTPQCEHQVLLSRFRFWQHDTSFLLLLSPFLSISLTLSFSLSHSLYLSFSPPSLSLSISLTLSISLSFSLSLSLSLYLSLSLSLSLSSLSLSNLFPISLSHKDKSSQVQHCDPQYHI